MLLREVRDLPQWHQAGLNSRQICFGGALTACGRGGQYAEARRLFEEMRGEGIPPAYQHFNALLTACARGGDDSTAAALFEEMRHAGLEPRCEDYTIRLGCTRYKLPDCERLFAEMQEKGIAPVRMTYEALADAALVAGERARARELLAEASAMTLEPPTKKTASLEAAAGEAPAGVVQPQAALAEDSNSAVPGGWRTANSECGTPYYWHPRDPAGTVTWERPA